MYLSTKIQLTHVLCSEFEAAGVDLSEPIVSTCGSGITACIVSFAANLVNKEVPVYDVRVTVVTQYPGMKQYCFSLFARVPGLNGSRQHQKQHGQNLMLDITNVCILHSVGLTCGLIAVHVSESCKVRPQ